MLVVHTLKVIGKAYQLLLLGRPRSVELLATSFYEAKLVLSALVHREVLATSRSRPCRRIRVPFNVIGSERYVPGVDQGRRTLVRIDETDPDIETIFRLELVIGIEVIFLDDFENGRAFFGCEILDLERENQDHEQHGDYHATHLGPGSRLHHGCIAAVHHLRVHRLVHRLWIYLLRHLLLAHRHLLLGIGPTCGLLHNFLVKSNYISLRTAY